MREIRISLDGNAVAVRTDAAEDARNAWAVMSVIDGGHWGRSAEVANWKVVIVDAG